MGQVINGKEYVWIDGKWVTDNDEINRAYFGDDWEAENKWDTTIKVKEPHVPEADYTLLGEIKGILYEKLGVRGRKRD